MGTVVMVESTKENLDTSYAELIRKRERARDAEEKEQYSQSHRDSTIAI